VSNPLQPPRAVGRGVESQGEVWEAPRPVDVAMPPKIEPCPPFFYMHHPNRWAVLGGKLRPSLGQLPLEPGLNGASDGDFEVAFTQKRREGWTIIPHDVMGGSYVRRHRARRGHAHLPRWVRVFGNSSTMVPNNEGPDGYFAFLDALMALPESHQSHIAPAELHALMPMADYLRGAMERSASAIAKDPRMKSRAERFRADLDVVEAAIAALGGGGEVLGDLVESEGDSVALDLEATDG